MLRPAVVRLWQENDDTTANGMQMNSIALFTAQPSAIARIVGQRAERFRGAQIAGT
jgi:hypothetical protein